MRARRRARTSASGCHRRHELRSVDEGQPFLRRERDGREPRRRECLGPAHQPAVDHGLSLADERQREVCQGREVAARPDRAPRRDARDDSGLEHVHEQRDRLHACARVPLGERVRPEQHRGPNHVVRVGLADAAGMAPEQPELELGGLLGRDRLGDEPPEPGVDAVRVVADLRLEEGARGGRAVATLCAEDDGAALDGDVPHVVDREVLAGQFDSAWHGASLDRHPCGPTGAKGSRTVRTRGRLSPPGRPAVSGHNTRSAHENGPSIDLGRAHGGRRRGSGRGPPWGSEAPWSHASGEPVVRVRRLRAEFVTASGAHQSDSEPGRPSRTEFRPPPLTSLPRRARHRARCHSRTRSTSRASRWSARAAPPMPRGSERRRRPAAPALRPHVLPAPRSSLERARRARRVPRLRRARPPRWRSRSTNTCGAVASRSMTFVEIWTVPPESRSPSACTPGSPPDDSRTASATSRAVSSVPSSSMLYARSGRRTPTSTAPARASSCRGPYAGVNSPVSIRRWSSSGPPRRKKAGRRPSPRRRRGTPGARPLRRPVGRPRVRPRRNARGRRRRAGRPARRPRPPRAGGRRRGCADRSGVVPGRHPRPARASTAPSSPTSVTTARW